MSMTKEEAIKRLEEIKASAWGYRIGKEVLGTPYGEFIDIVDFALPAPPGKDNNVPTKEQNEPLTIEQLREMDGEPVWVDFTGSVIKREPGWFILKNAQDEEVYLVGETSVYKGYEYYGKAWLAYRFLF